MNRARVWQLVAAVLLATRTVPVPAAELGGIRIANDAVSTRVVLELDSAAEHRVFTLESPDRIVIDLDGSAAAPGLALPTGTGVVTGFRSGSQPGGVLRLVIMVDHAIKPRTALLPPSEQYRGHRLLVDLPTTDRPSVVIRAPEAVAAADRELVIAIDAGHGGSDPGAIGRGGGREKDVVLQIARRLAAEIDAYPGMRAVLIRDGDYLVPHRKRMEIAHNAVADLFISIHADAYRDSTAKGATVYMLSKKGASDEAALLLAQRENADVSGVALAGQDEMVARVLLDMNQDHARGLSESAGQHLIRRLAAVTAMRKMQVQEAPFLVLKRADIPSLLIETGYISNPREETALRSGQHQATLARALRDGIVDYFAANPPQGTNFVRRDPAPSAPVKHVIARGETLSGIAERYRVSVAALLRTNSLRNADSIRIGQVLTIPRG